jgi:hypothetical protein
MAIFPVFSWCDIISASSPIEHLSHCSLIRHYHLLVHNRERRGERERRERERIERRRMRRKREKHLLLSTSAAATERSLPGQRQPAERRMSARLSERESEREREKEIERERERDRERIWSPLEDALTGCRRRLLRAKRVRRLWEKQQLEEMATLVSANMLAIH